MKLLLTEPKGPRVKPEITSHPGHLTQPRCEAEQYHLKIIQLRQSSLGPDHLETLQAVPRLEGSGAMVGLELWPPKSCRAATSFSRGASLARFAVFLMFECVWMMAP